MDVSVFEPIEHNDLVPAKVFVTGMESSNYHWHYDYELLVVLKGTLQVFCGPEPMLMQKGDILLVNSKAVHGYRGIEENLCLFLQFPASLLEPVAGREQLLYFYLNSVNEQFAPKGGYGPLIKAACRVALADSFEGQKSYLSENAALYMLLARLTEDVQYDIRRYPQKAGHSLESQLVAEIGAYIDANCEKQNLTESISRHFGLSEKSLYRYTKNFLGLSPKEMIDTARAERARQLLRSNESPISMIGQQCGFTNEATFHRVFKKETGITPKEYRYGGKPGPVGKEVQGYLSFDQREAWRLLNYFAQQDPGTLLWD